MTIDSPPQHHQLLLPAPLTFYNAKIPFRHWQLRSLLCSPSANILYYPTENNVYSLDTATRKRELLVSLPFGPRCIGARYGWVCCGGLDNGHFAAIRVGEVEKSQDHRLGAAEDEAMGLDMEVEEGSDGIITGGGIRNIMPIVKISELGGSIVNSVTLHRPLSSTSDDDVLAVLTNNDKTVRIFHLAENRVLTTLHLNIATNHASISPDGQHLVAVGDSPKVYFYHPAPSGSCPGTPGMGIGEAGHDSWILSSHPPLTAGTDALISTSFSPSSLMCAVASQDGSITIFDTRYLSPSTCDDCPSPIFKKISSSRPRTNAGAVRSVHFSPAPWDLLVWAEHSGRICVADARNGFTKQQVVEILAENDDLIEAEVISVGDNEDAQRSWRRHENSSPRRSTREEEPEEESATVDDEEIHAFFSRRYHELTGGLVAAHEWWTNPTIVAPNAPITSGTYLPNRPVLRSLTSNLTHSSSPLLPPTLIPLQTLIAQSITPPTASTPALLRDYRERQLERERARQRIHDPPPRRRNSTHPSYTDQSTSTISTPTQIPPPAPAPPLPPPGPNFIPSSPTDPLSHRNRGQFSAIMEERRRNYLRRRGTSSGVAAAALMEEMGYREEGDGVDITGCTMSCDGSKLYVATDGGVVEYLVDLVGRKTFPSFTPR